MGRIFYEDSALVLGSKAYRIIILSPWAGIKKRERTEFICALPPFGLKQNAISL